MAGPDELAQYATKSNQLPPDLAQFASKPGGSIAPDRFDEDERITDAWAQNHPILGPVARFLVSGGQNAARAITDTPGQVYHAIVDPVKDDELGLSPENRLIYRMGGKQAIQAGEAYASGKVTPKGALSVLPEALGTGVGQVAGGAVYGKMGEVAPEVLSSAKPYVTAPIRYGARATEAVANSKLRPFVKVMTPADDALASQIKVPGRDLGLSTSDAAPNPTPEVYAPGYRTPRSYYGGQPPAPIPPRSGLQLKGNLAQPIEGEYMPPDQPKPPLPFLRATPVTPRTAEPVPAPYRYGPGEIAPEDVNAPNPLVLGGNKGVRVPPQRTLALPESVSSRLPFLRQYDAPAEPYSAIGPQQVQDAAQRAMGHEPIKLQPSIPLREQLPFTKSRPAATPQGHSPVQSSALASYSYDPAAREFQAVTANGGHYIYGDVAPEQAAAFEQASSKGKAFSDLKNNSTLVAKVVNGKRIPVKPVASANYDPNDLTDVLQRSVKQIPTRK